MGSSLPRLPVKLVPGRRGKKKYKTALISSLLSRPDLETIPDLETESHYSIFLGWD